LGGYISSVAEWFGLVSDSYSIDPVSADFVALNEDFAEWLERIMLRTLASGIAPKFVLYHERGDGKTHISNYVVNKLRKYMDKIYIECPAMSRGSNYATLSAEIIGKMSNIVSDVLNKAWQIATEKASGAERLTKLEEVIEFKPLTRAYYEYRTGKASERDFSALITSERLTARQLESLGQTGPWESVDFCNLLIAIAKLFQRFNNRRILMIIIDETDNIAEARLGARDFKESFRRLADTKDLGLMFVYNNAPGEPLLPDSLPTPLRDFGVVSRIGPENYLIKPEPMIEEDVEKLIRKVNEKLVDRKEAEKSMKEAEKTYGNDFDDELYPFTKSGFKSFKDRVHGYLLRGGKSEASEEKKGLRPFVLPRSILRYANSCLGEAVLSNKRAIDVDVIKAVGEFKG